MNGLISGIIITKY